MKNNFLIITIILFVISFGYSQEGEYSWMRIQSEPENFTQIIDTYNNWIKIEYPDSIPANQLPNIKKYYRFLNYWIPRIGIDSLNNFSYKKYYEVATAVYIDPVCDTNDLADWQLVGPDSLEGQNMGLVDEVLFNPNISDDYLLSPNHGGIWKSQNLGNSWANKTDVNRWPGLSASEIVRNPFSPDTIYASTAYGTLGTDYGAGIIYSSNNGENWEIMESFPDYEDFPAVNKIICDPNDQNSSDGITLYAITKTKLFKSTNSGGNWNELLAPIEEFDSTNCEYIDIEIDSLGSIYLTTLSYFGNYNGSIFKYENNFWKNLIDSNEPIGNIQKASITKPYNGKIYMLCDSADGYRRYYQSFDYGESWGFMFKGDPSGHNSAWAARSMIEIEYSPESNLVYTGSVKFGAFRDEAPHKIGEVSVGHYDIRDIEHMGFDTIIGNDTTIWEKFLIATDGGISRVKVKISDIFPFYYNVVDENLNGNHLPIGNFIGMATDNSQSEFVVGGLIHCNSQRLENDTWIRFSEGDGGDCEINWLNPEIYYTQYNHRFKKNFTTGGSHNIYTDNSAWFIGMKYELHPNNPYILYGGRVNLIIKYNELTDVLYTLPAPDSIKQIGAIEFSRNNAMYVADFEQIEKLSLEIAKTFDEGNTWIDLSNNNITYEGGTILLKNALKWLKVTEILCNPNDTNEVWMSIGGIKEASSGSGPYPGMLRVIRSTDAGSTWHDYSTGLTALPALDLEYQTGSNDRIFVGTDAGVYYREPDMTQWECFSEGMPIGSVKDIDYDFCSGYLYGAMDSRAIWKTPLPFPDSTLTIKPGQSTWDYVRRVSSDIIIKNGATLTITDRLYVKEGKKIIVERGGKLILDGGLISNTCGDHWKGIEVWGNPNQAQTYANQGALIVQNGGTIENALCGVQSIKWSIPAGAETELPDYAYTGGMIITDDANFINNRVAIKFWDYDYAQSASFIKNTNFETNDNMLEGTAPETYIIINEIDGVDIYAGNFTDDHTVTAPNDLMTGIETFNATFKVTSYAGTSSYFMRLKDGIRALVSDPLKTPEITNNQFSNNLRSLYISSVSGAEVTGNDFIYWEGTVPANEPSYCMYLDQCTDYVVEENDFFFNQQQGQDPTGIGLIINNSGTNNNAIYNNAFTNLEFATLAQGNNRGFSEDEGLIIKCNDYHGNYQDISVTAEDVILPGIAKEQGAPGGTVNQAGNRFSLNNNGNDVSDYSTIKDSPINYYHHDPDASNEPKVEPIDYSKAVSPLDQGTIFIKELSCEPHTSGGGSGGGGERDVLESTMEASEYSADSTQAILTALVDGGNSQALEQEVLQSMPPETYDLYMSLIGKSPYLSDSVLIAAIEKEDVLPNVLIKDILVANPQAAKSPEILDKVDEKSNQMTPEMVAEILLGKYTAAAKEKLEANLANFKHQRSTALKFLKQSYMNDSINTWAMDSLIVLLENEEGLQEKLELTFAYINKGNWPQAQNLVNTLPSVFTFNQYQQTFYDDYSVLVNILIDLHQNGQGLNDIDEVQEQQLAQLADNTTNSIGAMARNILINYDDYFYQEPIILPDEGFKSGSFVFDLPDLKTFIPEYVKLYPNPAKDYIIIELLKGNINGASSTILDNRGIVVSTSLLPAEQQYHVLAIEDLKTGIYYLKIELDGKVLESKKFSIVK